MFSAVGGAGVLRGLRQLTLGVGGRVIAPAGVRPKTGPIIRVVGWGEPWVGVHVCCAPVAVDGGGLAPPPLLGGAGAEAGAGVEGVAPAGTGEGVVSISEPIPAPGAWLGGLLKPPTTGGGARLGVGKARATLERSGTTTMRAATANT